MTKSFIELLQSYSEIPDWMDEFPINANARNRYGDHLLDTAAAIGSVEDIVVLLKNGADVNATGEHGYTALHTAVEQGHTEAVSTLVEWGADILAKSQEGITPIDLAEYLGEAEIRKLLCSLILNCKKEDG